MLKKISIIKAMIFSSCHVWKWHLHHKEWWAMKNWWFWTVMLEKTLESPLDCKMIQPVNAKGNQSWILIGRTNAEIEPPILWPTDVKNDSLEKTLLLGKIEGRRREDDRGWDGLMESPTRWTWVYPSSRSGQASPGVLQSTGLQRVWHDWVTKLNRTYHIANTIWNGHVSPARLGLAMAPTYIPNQVCTHAQKSVPSIHKAFSEF